MTLLLPGSNLSTSLPPPTVNLNSLYLSLPNPLLLMLNISTTSPDVRYLSTVTRSI
ncbi:hypothetical protein SiRe_0882 [Sulfolobus islandicus REY15A]|uniref:Uncharacterized protein n=1 Tax=Saccharolobus islandicus (strain REY15A) TaxID=930945 RepID=F0NE19_SACI5|nr:hypothetical protein SiRe_0882 [Sulfolobus islandicus REY15A]